MEYINKMKLEFQSRSANEGFARSAVAAFAAQLDPTVEELTEIKTAVSEAVSNAVIHGYRGGEGMIEVEVKLTADRKIFFSVVDFGVGIEDVEKAREPLFTSDTGEERSGMGFTVMESFTDRMEVSSEPGKGTRVAMMKQLDQLYEL